MGFPIRLPLMPALAAEAVHHILEPIRVASPAASLVEYDPITPPATAKSVFSISALRN